MGSDSFMNLPKWKNYEVITQRYPIYVYRRPGFDTNDTYGGNIKFLDAPLLQISATQIRQLVKEGKSIRYLVTEKVMDEILKSSYYKK